MLALPPAAPDASRDTGRSDSGEMSREAARSSIQLTIFHMGNFRMRRSFHIRALGPISVNAEG
jgi:hypothetical protein